MISVGYSISVLIKGQDKDGAFIVETIRPFRKEESLMTYNKYKEHVKDVESYCKHKGYKFRFDDIDVFINSLLGSHEGEKE